MLHFTFWQTERDLTSGISLLSLQWAASLSRVRKKPLRQFPLHLTYQTFSQLQASRGQSQLFSITLRARVLFGPSRPGSLGHRLHTHSLDPITHLRSMFCMGCLRSRQLVSPQLHHWRMADTSRSQPGWHTARGFKGVAGGLPLLPSLFSPQLDHVAQLNSIFIKAQKSMYPLPHAFRSERCVVLALPRRESLKKFEIVLVHWVLHDRYCSLPRERYVHSWECYTGTKKPLLR